MPRTVRKPRPKPGDMPRGHAHRVALSQHRPESYPLLVCDLACLLSVCESSVRLRDGELRPARLGRGTRECRRYSWSAYLAYVDSVTPTKE